MITAKHFADARGLALVITTVRWGVRPRAGM